MDCPTLPSRGLASALAALVLTLSPSTGCGDDLPVGVADGGSSSSSSTGPAAMTTVSSADTTAGVTSDGTGSSSGTSSSSGDPGTTGTTAATDDSSDGTTAGSSSSGGTTDATAGGTTAGGTTDLTSGATTDLTSGATTDLTSGGTTDATGGTTDATGGSTGIDTDNVVELPDFSGDFLMAVATPLDPTLPLQYIASFDYVPSGMGGGTVDVELQPLALDTGSTTTPRTFFGPPLVFPGLPVTSDGAFSIPVGILNVAAETNPLFFIDAQANNVIFSSLVLDADNVCGTLSGMLVFPVANPLDGTTFAAVRVADVMPAGLPVVFPVACP